MSPPLISPLPPQTSPLPHCPPQISSTVDRLDDEGRDCFGLGGSYFDVCLSEERSPSAMTSSAFRLAEEEVARRHGNTKTKRWTWHELHDLITQRIGFLQIFFLD